MSESRDAMVTVGEAATMVGCHPATIVRMIRRGELKALRLGRQYRVRVSDLEPSFHRAPIREPVEREPVGRFSRIASEISRSGARSD
jgi:excisionase family DNA binding protein